MMLADRDIKRAISDGRIRVLPAPEATDFRPTGVRLHLAKEILVPLPAARAIDLSSAEIPPYERRILPPEGIIIGRGAFLLGSSLERVSTASDLVCLIDGRSTLARLGLMVHCASTTFDHTQDEFRSVTFELANVGPFDLRLQAGMAVGLLSFVQLSGPVEQLPNIQYRAQTGPTAPVLGTIRRKAYDP